MSRRRKRLVGAMCPTCRTVQDWNDEHIFSARIVCYGGERTSRHDRAIVLPVGAWVSR